MATPVGRLFESDTALGQKPAGAPRVAMSTSFDGSSHIR
jgi:hypothetical protein